MSCAANAAASGSSFDIFKRNSARRLGRKGVLGEILKTQQKPGG